MALLASLGIFFSAIVIHEFAHALVAFKFGDQTARRLGRLTLNPLAHVDPFGTIVLPALLILTKSPVLFGWAKPVPINFSNLHNPKRDIIWVGLAGPAANLLFALAAGLFLRLGIKISPSIGYTLLHLMTVHVVLAVFNLIPIPPLDGSRVVLGLLPGALAVRYLRLEPYGFLLLFALLYGGLFDRVVWPVALNILYLLTRL